MKTVVISTLYFLAMFLFASCSYPDKDQVDDASNQLAEPISLKDFSDVIKHWRDQHPGEPELLLEENNIEGIANNLLVYQRNNGGWPTNKNLLLILNSEQLEQLTSEKDKLDTSLDNRNTWPQIRYLAEAYKRTGNKAYRDAVIAGLDYILRSQYENGGWPHSPPSNKGYRGQITIADEVTSGVLSLVRDVAKQEPPFDFLDPVTVENVHKAWRKGEDLLLDLQVKIDGELTIWAGQYDKHTLEPVGARAFELPGLVSSESVDVVRYLMAAKNPDERIVNSINAAVTWFEKNKIPGIRIEKVTMEAERHKFHTSTYDLQVVHDENAPPIWARFYDLETQQPFMANRDGIKVFKLEDVQLERRTGYAWYGTWPQKLLEKEYPKWKEKIDRRSAD